MPIKLKGQQQGVGYTFCFCCGSKRRSCRGNDFPKEYTGLIELRAKAAVELVAGRVNVKNIETSNGTISVRWTNAE